MSNMVIPAFFKCSLCDRLLPVDVIFKDSIQVIKDFRWETDHGKIYCDRCALTRAHELDGDDDDDDKQSSIKISGVRKNRDGKENRIRKVLENDRPMNISEIAEMASLPRTTTKQRLHTMLTAGQVEKNGRYWKLVKNSDIIMTNL